MFRISLQLVIRPQNVRHSSFGIGGIGRRVVVVEVVVGGGGGVGKKSSSSIIGW